MRFSILSLLGFLTLQSAAAPGYDGCDRYEYKNICPNCPYHPHPRDLEGRGDGHDGKYNVCYKDCPSDWQQCNGYNERRGPPQYSLDYSQGFSCPQNFEFEVIVKIEEIQGEQYLNVNQNYQGGGSKKMMAKRGGISSSNLGVYKQQGSEYNPSNLNYNNYCHGNSCSVPVKNLPNYPNLCDTQIFLAVGNNGCYNEYSHDNKGYQQATKYVAVTVRCDGNNNHPKRGYQSGQQCENYCCCPRSY
jgi:hypothetical protein